MEFCKYPCYHMQYDRDVQMWDPKSEYNGCYIQLIKSVKNKIDDDLRYEYSIVRYSNNVEFERYKITRDIEFNESFHFVTFKFGSSQIGVNFLNSNDQKKFLREIRTATGQLSGDSSSDSSKASNSSVTSYEDEVFYPPYECLPPAAPLAPSVLARQGSGGRYITPRKSSTKHTPPTGPKPPPTRPRRELASHPNRRRVHAQDQHTARQNDYVDIRNYVPGHSASNGSVAASTKVPVPFVSSHTAPPPPEAVLRSTGLISGAVPAEASSRRRQPMHEQFGRVEHRDNYMHLRDYKGVGGGGGCGGSSSLSDKRYADYRETRSATRKCELNDYIYKPTTEITTEPVPNYLPLPRRRSPLWQRLFGSCFDALTTTKATNHHRRDKADRHNTTQYEPAARHSPPDNCTTTASPTVCCLPRLSPSFDESSSSGGVATQITSAADAQ